MSYIFTIIFVISIVVGLLFGKSEELTNSIMQSCQDAVSLAIDLAGAMAFWGGIMNIAKKSGLSDLFVKFLSPILKLIFKGLNENGKAFKAVVMNIVANMLGLGNAATPLGIEAVKEMTKEEKSGGKITKNLATFIVLNTASVQLIPVTVGTLRQKYGSQSPFDVTACILIASLFSVVTGVLTVKFLYSHGGKNDS